MTDDESIQSASGTERPVLSSEAFKAVLRSVHQQITFDSLHDPSHLNGADPNWPFPDGGEQTYWNALMRSFEGR